MRSPIFFILLPQIRELKKPVERQVLIKMQKNEKMQEQEVTGLIP